MTIYSVKDKSITFNLPNPRTSYRIGAANSDARYQVLELYGGFDIETTNIFQVEKEFPGWHAYAYHFQISLYSENDQYVYLFREWSVLLWFIDHIADVYALDDKKHLILWVANFSFEFQFIRKRLKWDETPFSFFAKEERQPLRATYRGIEFRECLTISGGNLAQLAKDYCTTQKLITEDPVTGEKISDLDYSIQRNYKTPLTKLEKQYCINDVVILAEFSQYIFKEFIRKDHYIPMTKTSVIINGFKKIFRYMCHLRDKKHGLEIGTSEAEYYKYIYNSFPDYDTYYLWMHYLFRGGYVHANATYSGAGDIKAKMRDITSHYPARMNLAYYPRTPFKKKPWDPDLLKTKCCIIRVQFDHIRATTTHSIESKNKLIQCIGGKFDNGRLYYADMIEVILTELDFKIYQLFYTWEGDPTIISFETAERGKQPPFILQSLNTMYAYKNELKRQGLNKTPKYNITKAGVNTHYGAEVKRIRIEQSLYDFTNNMWYSKLYEPDFEKERKRALLLPQMGIWVTAHARYELLTMLYRLTNAGVTVYYMDTDSIKYKPCHKAEQIFKHYNNSIKRHRHNRKLRNTNFDDLGEFDQEEHGAIVRFKTLGAKRYIYQVGDEIVATVAGMPKMSIRNLGDSADAIFEAFNLSGFKLTPEESEKLTTKYSDTRHTAIIDGVLMEEESSVALYKIPFKITLKEEYTQLILERRSQKCNL